MKYIVSGKEIGAIDDYTIDEIGISSLVLMEKASMAVASKVVRLISKVDRVLVVVEGGNNGADGLVVARLLHHMGYLVDVFYIKQIANASPQFEIQLGIVNKLMIPVYNKMPRKEYSLVVDGIFGVGLSREIIKEHKRVIDNLNSMDIIRVAIDIPSGIDATTGNTLGVAFNADYTVTFGMIKRGMLYREGIEASGEITVADIGYPDMAVNAVSPMTYGYDETDLDRLPKRISDSHKGTYGKVLIIAGSENIAGAALFSAKAAYVTGAGLVKIITHVNNRTMLQTNIPEALIHTYEKEEQAEKLLEEYIGWADAIVIGPGLGTDAIAKNMVEYTISKAKVPVVVDADGLNVLADCMDILKSAQEKIILTPHIKEMSRMIKKDVDYVVNNKLEVARYITEEYNVVCVLKSDRSIVHMLKVWLLVVQEMY